MLLKKAIFILVMLAASFAFGQQEQTGFMAFGQITTKVKPEHYRKLHQAKTPETRLAYLDTIAKFF